MSDYEINLGHFLPNQKVISQMNHTAMNNSIWTSNSQSFSYFQNLKVCRAMFEFCVHALLNLDAAAGELKSEYAPPPMNSMLAKHCNNHCSKKSTKTCPSYVTKEGGQSKIYL